MGFSTALPLIASVPVGATTTPGEPEPGLANNCVVDVNRGANKLGAERCFSTFTEAIRYATDGAIANAPVTAVEGVDDPALNALLGSSGKSVGAAAVPAANGTQTLIGIEYSDANFGGTSMIFRGPQSCTGPTSDIDYSIDLPREFWDRISSFKNNSNCFTNHYAFSDFRPPDTGYLNDHAVMPIVNGRNFNDDTRSIRWS
ncbi:hypothetical protein [Streptosporangium sp. NPDC002721]|uniref:hypothetical protein n=1 Tax=Streptosporangium sp. NPDC002721 TaxID=3366188 RepID=UPI0036D1DFC5